MGKTSQKQKEKRLAGRVSLALAAGMFSVVPVAHGMPTLDNVEHGDVKFNGATPNPGDVLASGAPITSGTKNNIINWKDFSVAHGEHVNFADNNNYMNIVTGKATSAIDGMLSSKGGDIYVINPNGVIFGKNAEVNVGNLYVSTRAATDNVKSAFLAEDGEGNPAPICTPFGDVLTEINANTATAAADVVNLIDKNGYVAANKVVMEGRNIRFLNTDSVAQYETLDANYAPTGVNISGDKTNGFQVKVVKDNNGNVTYDGHLDKDKLILRANSTGYIHVGDERNTYNNSTAHFTSGKVDNGITSPSVVNYTLIHNAAELQAINGNKNGNNIVGNYMLANDINKATITKPIGTASASAPKNYDVQNGGTPFTGNFDGMFFTVENLNPTASGNGATWKTTTSYAGLFAYTMNAVIENVGVSGANVKAGHAGGIVGYADNTTLRNVWNAGGSGQIGDDAWAWTAGGLVGVAANSTEITSSYNAGKVMGAGLVGTINKATISDAYNIGNVVGNDGAINGIFSQADGTGNSVTNTYTAAVFKGGASSNGYTEKIYSKLFNNASGTWNNNYIISSAKYSTSNYIGFNITDQGGIDANGKSHTWRIYEGSSLPMLTAFFKGTVSTDYTYDKNGTDTKVEGGHALDANGNPVDGNPSKVYDATAVNPTAAFLGMNATTEGGSTNGKVADTKITTNGNVNAKSNYALFTGEQQGYDLYGNYFTIEKRKIAFTQDTAPTFEKIYDGNADGTDALKAALMNASSTSTTGFIGKDKDYVDFQVKAGVTATYGVNGDTWTNKSDASVNGNWDIKVDGASSTTITLAAKSGVDAEHANTWQNYDLTGIDALNKVYTGKGVITPRSIKVSLRSTDGINKAYDGTSDLVGTFTVNEGTELEPDEKTYSYATDNLLVALDETGLTDAEKTALKTNDFNNQDVAINEHNSDTNPGGYTSGYVDNSGNATSVVTGTADSTKKHVAYKGIKLAGNALSSNYQLTDADGKALTLTDAEDASKGYTLLADGKINRRNISKNDLEYKDATVHPLQKVYDNTSALDDTSLAGKTVGMVDGKLIDFTQEGVTPATHTTGLLSTDADKIAFLTTGKGTFYTNATGDTEAKDATESGLATAAHNVAYGVVLANTSDADVAANYTIGDGNNLVNLEDATGFTLMAEGEILRRAISVELVNSTGINKTYDGTAAVDAAYTAGRIDKDGVHDGADANNNVIASNIRYASGSATVVTGTAQDGVSLRISTDVAKTKYLKTHSETNAQDVALDDSSAHNVMTGDNSKNLTFTIAMSGDKAANYTLNGTDLTDDVKEVTLGATGKIAQKEITATFAEVSKIYDGDAVVTNSGNDVITPTVTGLTGNDGFTSANVFEIGGVAGIVGTYGSGETDETFEANKNVGIFKDVQYSNLQQALAMKTKNYKISNTAYGKGAITKKNISLQDLDDATDTNQTSPFTKVYDGNAEYDKTGLIATDFIGWKDNQSAIAEGDKGSVHFTIAEVVYSNDTRGSKNAGVFDGVEGNEVRIKFNITGDSAANYSFDNAVIDATDGSQTVSLTKGGYVGEIEKRKVTAGFANGDPSPVKDYDGTTTLKANGTTITNDTIKSWFSTSTVAAETTAGRPSGIVAEEDVTLSVTGTYTGKDAGTSTVQYDLALADGANSKASNYELVKADGTAPLTAMQGVGTINKRTVYVSSVDEMDKSYNQDNSGVHVLAQAANGIHLSAVSNGSAEDDEVVAALLSSEGLDVIKPVAANAASGVKGQYGELAGTTFTANGNVRRDSVEEDPEKWDTRFEGMDEAFATVYKNYQLSATLSGEKVKVENNKNIVYGKGTINAANINLDGVTVANTIRHEYNNSVNIAKEEALPAISGIDSSVAPLLNITAAFSDNNVNVGTSKPIALTIALSTDVDDAKNYTISGNTSKTIDTATGEIYARKLYAYIDEPDATDTYSPLTKTYDGTDTVNDQNVSTWVKLTDPTRLLNDGVTFVYADDSNVTYVNADADESGNKAVNFANVGLTGNSTHNNYKLVLLAKGEEPGATTNAEPLTGDAKGTLTTTGIINKRTIYLEDFSDPINRAYNGTADVDIIAALTPTLEMDLTDLSDVQKTALAGDLDALGIKEGTLRGVYGEWNPAGTEFRVDSHVKYQANQPHTEEHVAAKDVLYYGMELANKNSQNDVLKNYKLADSGDRVGQVTIKSEDGLSNLASTVYFQEAKKTGFIRPLAISVDAVREKWTAPVTKVYDGNAWITSHGTYTAYDTDGNPITDSASKYLTIYYDATADTLSALTAEEKERIGQVPIAYDMNATDFSATYDDANAGNQTFTYRGLTFSTATLEDFKVDGTQLAAKYADGVSSATAKNYTTDHVVPVTGTIARRLINVTEDGVAHNKVYNGQNQWNVISAGTNYTAGIEEATNHTGIVTDDVSITYEANYVNGATKDANVSFDTNGNVTFKDVEYTFTLAGNGRANYTLQPDKQTAFNDEGALTSKVTQQGKSKISQREVYVDFVGGNTGFDKVYDNSPTVVLPAGTTMQNVLKVKDVDGDTGIVDAGVGLDYAHVTANYVNSRGEANEDVAISGNTVTAKKVYFQNLNLVGEGKDNYVVKAKNATGNEKASATDATQKMQTLEGSGKIAKRTLDLALINTPVTKQYDGTAEVKDYGGTAYRSNNVRIKAAGIVDVNGQQVQTYDVADGDLPTGILSENEKLAALGITVDKAFYHDSNAGTGLGVTYRLKIDNKNYELIRTSIETNGNIKQYVLKTKANVSVDDMSKIYDGTQDVTASPAALADKLFDFSDDDNPMSDTEKKTLLQVDSSHYDHADTQANVDSVYGAEQNVTFDFTILNPNYALNTDNNTIQMVATNPTDNLSSTGKFTGKGRIDRAPLTLVPNSATYSSGDTIPTDGYTGTVMGFKNGENLADGYVVTFARDPQNLATTPGKYSLVGYVNGQLPTQANGRMYYNNLGDGATGNYYFVQQPNNALQINAKADVMDEVNQSTIADKKFTPDDYSYNRMSKDPDLTRMNRESSATVQYSEKGVNIDGDDTKSGLSALADIKGAGSVVNLEGAFIRTSAPAEQPETVAAEAALPVPETEESDISSISLEYAGDGDNSQALLEILTNASSNAEKKGTSIVIDAQDEDEEDAEEEKSRRAIFADRSNIGIETLGDAVNLNQMIG